MKRLILSLALLITLPVVADGDRPKRAQHAKQDASAPVVEASYGYSAETVYREIVVKGGKLRYTYTPS
jgi:hypothetical protein